MERKMRNSPTTKSTTAATILLGLLAATTFVNDGVLKCNGEQEAVNLPSYVYNLTMETNATRTGICAQTVNFCAAAQCVSASANVTTNFCNPVTMGYNCECDGNSASRLQPSIVPVNSYDCRLRLGSCLLACQNPHATPAVKSIGDCQNACNYVIGSTCGTADQVIPEYMVNSYNDIPKYYPDTSKGGVALGITTASTSSGNSRRMVPLRGGSAFSLISIAATVLLL